MNLTIDMLLYILALLCFLLATFGANVKINLTALGLALLTLSLII